MSKRPLHPAPKLIEDRVCLDFHAWKAQRDVEALERDDDYVYDFHSEDLPDHLWYTLDREMLCKTISDMCTELRQPVGKCDIADQEITNLLSALERARLTPPPKMLNIAVVGHQGIGKSSTINALLNRYLVDVSASSSACTTFATIIEYKFGAADNTDMSDLKVTFLDINEIRDFIEEHIRRYADVWSPSRFDDDEDLGEEYAASADGDYADDELEECPSDTDEAQEVVNKKKMKKNVTKALKQGADTAEQFFRIMFNADDDKTKEVDLQKWLNTPDLEDGRFLDHCTSLAMAHLQQIKAEEKGSVEYTDVNDADLQRVRDHAAKMWPLIKAVTISTGSVLLRNGIRFMDLPGYGDLNQTRTAVVNEYRRMANFEIIVAKSDRYLSKTDEDRYLTRAIRHHGADNIFLVLNKADSCLETPQSQVMRLLKRESEEPFASIGKHLSNVRRLTNEDRSLVQDYCRHLVKEAQIADGERECNKIKHQMRKKGVQVFPVSAARYFEWLDPARLDDPLYKPDETGIPLLRKSLLMLPAEANYQDLSSHVLESLADIQDKVSRIMEKFTDDDDITSIRQYVLGYIPQLGSKLRTVSTTVPQDIIPHAWDYTERSSITTSLRTLIGSYQNTVHVQTFWLMLRNKGIATHGKYAGKNLNDEFLQTYKSTIRRWKIAAMPKAKELTKALGEVIQDALTDLQQRLHEASSDPSLKQRANAALTNLTARINIARGRLENRLEGSISENYIHFTTEDDIKCPVAQALRCTYIRIESIRKFERRRNGIYKQQRTELILTTTSKNESAPPLIDTIRDQVKTRQVKKWQGIEDAFIIDVLGRFKEFARVLQDLLENETYMSDAHKLVRKGLARKLPRFEGKITEVKSWLSGGEVERTAKKAKKGGSKSEGNEGSP